MKIGREAQFSLGTVKKGGTHHERNGLYFTDRLLFARRDAAMKKSYRTLLALFAGISIIGLGASQCLSANTDETPAIQKNHSTLSRDGSAVSQKNRITQAERQAAANRAKAKGFVAPTIEDSTMPVDTTPTKGGPKK